MTKKAINKNEHTENNFCIEDEYQDKKSENVVLESEQEIQPEKAKIEKIEEWLFFHYDFRMNRTTCTLEFKKKTDAEYIDFQDENMRDIVIELKKKKFSKPKEDLEDLLRSSRIEKYYPLKDFFTSLQLKGVGYIQELANCIVLDKLDIQINEKDYQALFNEYFKKWLVACYLCSTEVKQNDVMLILIGAQGRFKTSFLNFLCPTELENYRVCSHINPSLTDYNTTNYLAEKFFINIDDQMETIFGKDYNCMKAIVSAPDVTNRKLYSSSARKRTRIANLCGSVNESRFLRDSNNRRYLCFKIVDINPNYVNIDINQVWAEVAFEAKKLKTMYVFGKEDYKNIDLMNEAFEAPTEEAEALKATFEPANENETWEDIYYMSFTEILRVLKAVTANNNLKHYNIQTAMRKYNFESKSFRKERFVSPAWLYPVRIVTNKEYVHEMCREYKE